LRRCGNGCRSSPGHTRRRSSSIWPAPPASPTRTPSVPRATAQKRDPPWRSTTNRSYTRIRFDSHVVSYHQVAQAVAEAGKSAGKNYDPYLVFIVSEYARSNNAADVDAIFAGNRLNTRVPVAPLDKAKGEFSVHFLPLKSTRR